MAEAAETARRQAERQAAEELLRVEAEQEAAAAAAAKQRAKDEEEEAARLLVKAEAEARAEADRMKSPLYVWLKTLLHDKPQDAIVSTFEKFQDIDCHSTQHIIVAKITKTDLRNDMDIPLGICVRILRSLEEIEKACRQPPQPPVVTSKQTAPASPAPAASDDSKSTIARKLILLQSFRSDGVVSSGKSKVVNGQYSDGSQLLTGELIWKQVKVKLFELDDAHAIPSNAAKEFKFLQCLHATCPGVFVTPFALLTANEIHVEGSEERVECAALVMEKGLTTLEGDLLDPNSVYDIGVQIRTTSRLLNIVHAAHECQITLMDFKCANVVFFHSAYSIHLVLKGIDLDGSLLTGTPLSDSQFAGTMANMAPELVTQPMSELFAIPQLDIWSLGMVVFQIFSGSTFWNVQGLINDDQIVQKMKSSAFTQASINRVIDQQFHGNDSLRHFLKDVLHIDPEARATLRALRSRALMTGGNSLTASKIYNAVDHISVVVDDIQLNMNTLMALTKDGLLTVNEGIQSLVSAGLAFSPTTDTMIDTFKTMQTSCNEMLIIMQDASKTDLVNMFGEFKVSIEDSLGAYKAECEPRVTDDSVLNSLQQQDAIMMSGFAAILDLLKDSSAQNVVDHSELTDLIGALSGHVTGVGEGVNAIIVLAEGVQSMQYDLLTGLRSVQQDVYRGAKDREQTLSALRAVELSFSVEIGALRHRVVECIQKASGDSHAIMKADILGLIQQQAQFCQDSGLDDVTTTLNEILLRTEAQAASPVNTASVINLLTSLTDSVGAIASDLQEVKVDMKTLSAQVFRQHEMLTDLLTGESRIPTLFCCSLEVARTKLDSFRSLFRVSTPHDCTCCCIYISVLLMTVLVVPYIY
jgi:serine/threonine protein kinase